MKREAILTVLAIGVPGAVLLMTTKLARATGDPSQTYCTNSQVTCYDDVTVSGTDEIDYTVAQTGNPVIGTESGAYALHYPSGDYYYLEAATLCGSTWVYSNIVGPYYTTKGAAGAFCSSGHSSEGWAEYWLY